MMRRSRWRVRLKWQEGKEMAHGCLDDTDLEHSDSGPDVMAGRREARRSGERKRRLKEGKDVEKKRQGRELFQK